MNIKLLKMTNNIEAETTHNNKKYNTRSVKF